MKMKLYKVLLLLLLVAVAASKKAHRRKSEKKHFVKEITPEKEKDVMDLLENDEIEDEKKKKSTIENELILEDFDNAKGGYVEDPCAKHKCGPGKQCDIDEDGKAVCNCVKKCPSEGDIRRRVCSNHNETWESDCELYRMRCLCTEDLEGCKKDKYRHVHIDYYGPCKVVGNIAKALAKIEKRLTEIEKNQAEILSRLETNNSTGFIDLSAELIIPCDSVEDVDRLEEGLKCDGNNKSLIANLSILGGKKVANTVRRILEKLFTNKVAASYNYTGKHQKHALKDLAVIKIIPGIVRRNKNTLTATDEDVYEIKTNWF